MTQSFSERKRQSKNESGRKLNLERKRATVKSKEELEKES